MAKRHLGIAAAKPHRLLGKGPVRSAGSRHAPEIVEADLRRRKLRKLRRYLAVEVTQQTIAKTVVRQCAKLLLDALKRAPERFAAAERRLKIQRAKIKPHRE